MYSMKKFQIKPFTKFVVNSKKKRKTINQPALFCTLSLYVNSFYSSYSNPNTRILVILNKKVLLNRIIRIERR